MNCHLGPSEEFYESFEREQERLRHISETIRASRDFRRLIIWYAGRYMGDLDSEQIEPALELSENPNIPLSFLGIELPHILAIGYQEIHEPRSHPILMSKLRIIEPDHIIRIVTVHIQSKEKCSDRITLQIHTTDNELTRIIQDILYGYREWKGEFPAHGYQLDLGGLPTHLDFFTKTT